MNARLQKLISYLVRQISRQPRAALPPSRSCQVTIVGALIAVLLSVGGGSAFSQSKAYFTSDPELQKDFIEAAGDLRCPTCTGLSVLESDARFSVQIKDLVEEQVAAGKSKDEIIGFFTERYGSWILRAPPTAGFDLIAWLLPMALLLLGPPIIWLLVWRKRRQVDTGGVRSNEVILAEMQTKLSELRSASGSRLPAVD